MSGGSCGEKMCEPICARLQPLKLQITKTKLSGCLTFQDNLIDWLMQYV